MILFATLKYIPPPEPVVVLPVNVTSVRLILYPRLITIPPPLEPPPFAILPVNVTLVRFILFPRSIDIPPPLLR